MATGKRGTGKADSGADRRGREGADASALVPRSQVRRAQRPRGLRTRGASRADLLALMRESDVRFLRLQFIDILGTIKNVEVPEGQFEKALDGDIMFDGSSIAGFVRTEESDMVLRPDPDTYMVLPIGDEENKVARLICDVYTADDEPFEGDPRWVLRRQIEVERKLGYEMMEGEVA